MPVIIPRPFLGYIFLNFNNPDLTAAYTMDNISGASLIDESGNGYNQVITGATAVAGKYGNALNFSDTSTYITHTLPAFGTNDWAISLWYNPDTITLYTHLLTATTGQDDFALKIGDTGFAGLPYIYTLATGTLNHNNSVIIGSWNHIVFNKIGTDFFISLNGVNQLVSSSFTVNLTTTTFFTGKGHAIEAADGRLDQMRIFNRGLTTEEITELYNE